MLLDLHCRLGLFGDRTVHSRLMTTTLFILRRIQRSKAFIHHIRSTTNQRFSLNPQTLQTCHGFVS
jgi:hypothetical protein